MKQLVIKIIRHNENSYQIGATLDDIAVPIFELSGVNPTIAWVYIKGLQTQNKEANETLSAMQKLASGITDAGTLTSEAAIIFENVKTELVLDPKELFALQMDSYSYAMRADAIYNELKTGT